MPPKAKFTRQEIVEAAVDIARRAPLEAVTAQELASVLGTSTRPVFTYFRTLEEVRAAVVEEAGKIYGRYVERGLSMNPPFKGYGMETIRFAREEPNLFRLLFLCRRDTAEFPPTENHSADIRRAIRETFSLTDAQADELHRHLCSRALHADRHGRERHTGHGGGPSARRGVPGAAHCAARAARRADRHRSGQEG